MSSVRFRRALRLIIGLGVIWLLFDGSPRYFLRNLSSGNQVEDEPKESISRPPEPTNFPVARFPQLGRHFYRSDGLLEFNPAGPHPIFELIEKAEKEWKNKLFRASTSLDEAVQEYRRRYKRNPPKGFDGWWDYVHRNDVQLPDEYDQIYHDLEPFWGIKPSDLLKIQSDLEDKIDSYTVGKTEPSSPVDVLKTSFEQGKYDQLIHGSVAILDLLRDIEEFLPPFRMVLSPHDGPNRLSDYNVKTAVLDAAGDDTYIGRGDLPKITPKGWASACSPFSNLSILHPINLNEPPPFVKPPKSFIHNHRLTMDPCLHPDHLWHHGQFLSHNTGPTPQHEMVPEFSYCTTTIHHNIHIPTPYGWLEDIPRDDDPEWEDKFDERLLWRGSNTGIFHADHTRWRTAHRTAMVGFTNEMNGTLDVIFPPRSGVRRQAVGEPRKVKKAHINPAVFDIAFAGKPASCSGATCKLLETLYPWRPRQSQKEAGNYKYVLDVDGNGWSGRFKRLMTSNSLVFKSTIYPEWYMDRIAPWVHYVPVQVNLSDLHDVLVFFRGDGNGEGGHEDLARNIALAGRTWSKTFWRREDLVAYFYRLILEYARLMSLDRKAMTFKGDGFRARD